MNKNLLVLFTLPMLLASCGTCPHKDDNHDHVCDLCGETISSCFDGDFDVICDYCGNEMPVPSDAFEWPTDEIQSLVKEVSGSEAVLPAYKYATNIEVNTDDLVLDGYFGIFCSTDNEKSELEYKAILTRAGWEVSDEKENNYYDAYDPNKEIRLNFGYFSDYSDLEIYVTMSYKTDWPAKTISDGLQSLVPGTKTVIPAFQAYTIIATYYPLYETIAINGYYFESTIMEDYKAILETNGWTSFKYDEVQAEYNAISPYNDVQVTFYIDDSKNEFNVDVQKYIAPVEGWPLDEINSLINELGATGEIPPYVGGKQTSFVVSSDMFGCMVVVHLKSGVDEKAEAAAYLEYIQELGYVYAGNNYVDNFYAKPDTTLGITAYYATEGTFTIEFDNINNLQP